MSRKTPRSGSSSSSVASRGVLLGKWTQAYEEAQLGTPRVVDHIAPFPSVQTAQELFAAHAHKLVSLRIEESVRLIVVKEANPVFT